MTTNRPPRCLVLLATYNGAAFLTEQLESILAQSGVVADVLIRDDASTDDTVKIAERLGHRGNIMVWRCSVETGSAAQNFAALIREVDASAHDYIAFSDQDDIWMANKLEIATQALAASGAGGYSCSVIARWPNGRETLFRQSQKPSMADFLFEGAGQGCTFVLAREFFEQVQETFRRRTDLTASLSYHDWAIYAIARALEVRWIFDSAPHMWYRQHPANDTGARHSVAGLHRRVRMIVGGKYSSQIDATVEITGDLAPQNPYINKWKELGSGPPNMVRRMRKALFCIRHGRRRTPDRVLTALAALAGYI